MQAVDQIYRRLHRQRSAQRDVRDPECYQQNARRDALTGEHLLVCGQDCQEEPLAPNAIGALPLLESKEIFSPQPFSETS